MNIPANKNEKSAPVFLKYENSEMVACVWYEQGAAAIAAASGGGNKKNKIEYKIAKIDADARHHCILFSRSCYSVFKALTPKARQVIPSLLSVNPIKSYIMDPVKF